MRCAMTPPLSSRHVTDDARATRDAGLRCAEAFTGRRGPIWLASAERHTPAAIAKTWRGAPPTVRQVVPAFHVRGLPCGQRGSNGPITVEPGLHAATREPVRALLPHSPRTFGPPARVWTRTRLAAVCHEQGLRATPLAGPTMLEASVRLGVSGHRAQHGRVSPDPADARHKPPRPAAPEGRQPAGPGAGLRRCGLGEP
jgi:hypothetical protein